MRTGETVSLTLPVRNGMLHVPTMGALAVGSGAAAGRTMRISISTGRLAPGNAGTWHEVRRLAGPVLRATLEDLDPFRDCQEWPAASRLSAEDWLVWRQRLDAAGRRLAKSVPAYARVLGVGLRSVVPLRPGATGLRSSTACQAFGAVAVTLPRRHRDLDALLVHEFQHVKLNALLDMHELFDAKDTQRLMVPWRPDARPVGGALHGAYAHLALTHLQQARGPAARADHLRYRTWVCDAVTRLSATGALTRYGERFVAGMRAAAEGSLS